MATTIRTRGDGTTEIRRDDRPFRQRLDSIQADVADLMQELGSKNVHVFRHLHLAYQALITALIYAKAEE